MTCTCPPFCLRLPSASHSSITMRPVGLVSGIHGGSSESSAAHLPQSRSSFDGEVKLVSTRCIATPPDGSASSKIRSSLRSFDCICFVPQDVKALGFHHHHVRGAAFFECDEQVDVLLIV